MAYIRKVSKNVDVYMTVCKNNDYSNTHKEKGGFSAKKDSRNNYGSGFMVNEFTEPRIHGTNGIMVFIERIFISTK